MYYLGQAVVIRDTKTPAIFIGENEKAKDSYWVFHLYNEKYPYKDNGEDEGDEFSYELKDLEIIVDTPSKYKELKDLPIRQCIYKGEFCTDRLRGALTDEFVEQNRKGFIKLLKRLEKQECFVTF